MRFWKEYVIISVLLAIIFGSDYITSRSLADAVGWMRDGITSIENKMNEGKKAEAKEEFYDLQEKWKAESEKLSFFVEHNELEKVTTNIVLIEANLEAGEMDRVQENTAELKFILEHIAEKNHLMLKNVF